MNDLRRSIIILENNREVLINFPSVPDTWNENINGFTVHNKIYKMTKTQHEIFKTFDFKYKITIDGVKYKIENST